MRSFCSLVCFILILGLFSCSDTHFSTTQSKFRNGRTVYVNKKERNSIKPNRFKTKISTSQKNDQNSPPGAIKVDHAQPQTVQIAGSDLSPEMLAVVLKSQNSKPAVTESSNQPENSKDAIIEYHKKIVQESVNQKANFRNEEKNYRKYQGIQADTVYYKKDTNKDQYLKRKNVAVGSMVVGIIGFIVAGIILGSIALATGFAGLRKTKKYPKKYKGKGFAIAAIILGFLDIIGAIVALIILL